MPHSAGNAKAGEKAAELSCGSPLLCCQTDGQAVAAGTQAGQVDTPFEVCIALPFESISPHDRWSAQRVPHMCYTPEDYFVREQMLQGGLLKCMLAHTQ